MKKIFLIGFLVLFVGIALTETKTEQTIDGGPKTILAYDTVGVDDSIKVPLYFVTRELEGYHHLLYIVRTIANNTKLKIYFEETIDKSHGYFNRTLIDSVVAAESTLVEHPTHLKGVQYGQYVIIGFGAADDTSGIKIILQSLPK